MTTKCLYMLKMLLILPILGLLVAGIASGLAHALLRVTGFMDASSLKYVVITFSGFGFALGLGLGVADIRIKSKAMAKHPENAKSMNNDQRASR